MRSLLSNIVMKHFQSNKPQYDEDNRPKWWNKKVDFIKPNKLIRQQLLEVLKGAPVEEPPAVETRKTVLPKTHEELLENPPETLTVETLRKLINSQLKSEPFTGKTRYIPHNKPSWWPTKVGYKKTTSLLKLDLIEIVKNLQNLKVTEMETPGMRSSYSMDNPVKGICLAILNGIFEKKKHFETKFDKEIITETFRKLNFECHIHKNLQAEEMLKVIKDTAANDHSRSDALVLFVSSHGSKDIIYGTDNKPVAESDIKECFNSINCQTLANKPKLLVFDVCRGDKVMEGLIQQKSSLAASDTSDRSNMKGPVMSMTKSGSSEGVETSEWKPVPELADMLVAYATCRGYVAFAESRGAVFIQNFCHNLLKMCNKQSVTDILQYTAKHVSSEYQDEEQKENKRPLSGLTVRDMRSLLSNIVMKHFQSNKPQYDEDNRPKWWNKKVDFIKPNKLIRQQLLEVLKGAPVEEPPAVETRKTVLPKTHEELLENPPETLTVETLRKLINSQLKSEPFTGKTRYIPHNKPSWWPTKVGYKKTTSLLKLDLIEIVKNLQNLKVTEMETPGMRSSYSMDNPVKGICLAILNGIFEKEKHFETKFDKEIITETFRKLNFECHIHKNLQAEEMLKVIKDTAANDHSRSDALVLFVSSHGSKDIIYGTDNKPVAESDIKECFNSINCQTLANKPKLLVFDVCRGDKVMEGLIQQKSSLAASDTSDRSNMKGPVMSMTKSGSSEGVETSEWKPVPELADMLVAYATCRGYVAFAESRGAVFIQNFCHNLLKMCNKQSVTDILQYTAKHVSSEYQDEEQKENKRPLSGLTVRDMRSLLSNIVMKHFQSNKPQYDEDNRPKWWNKKVDFIKPNKLIRQQLLEVLKGAPVEEPPAVETRKTVLPKTHEELLENPPETLTVETLRKLINSQLKSEPFTGKTRYIPHNKPSWWPTKVGYKKTTSLLKLDLIEIVKNLQNLKVTEMETPGMRSSYSMDNPVKGICLAILNGIFEKKKHFETKFDNEIITETFRKLNFECHIHKNLQAEEMLKVIKDTAANDHSRSDALVLFVSSHGSKDIIYGTDNKPVAESDIKECFNSINCQTLANKPKLLVFDVCRGDKVMEGLIQQKSSLAASDTSDRSNMKGPVMSMTKSGSSEGVETSEWKPVPELADMLVAYATCRGYVAFAESRGAVFIQNFCHNLLKMCNKQSVTDILQYTAKHVSSEYQDEEQVYLQLPETVSTLRHKWTFY